MMNLDREDIGVDILIMTIDISMKALAGEVDQIDGDALRRAVSSFIATPHLETRPLWAEAAGRNDRRAQNRADGRLRRCAVS